MLSGIMLADGVNKIITKDEDFRTITKIADIEVTLI